MKFYIALAISLLLHLGVYYYFSTQLNSKTPDKNTVSKKPKGSLSTQIKYVKIKPKKISKPLKNIKQKPQVQKKKQSKPKPHTITQPKIIKIPKNIHSKKVIPQKVVKKKPIDKHIDDKIDIKKIDEQTKKFVDLYENFDAMPTKTKIFLIKHLKDIGKITERYLMYPSMSAQAGQEGINVVEFMLFKNGNISTPKIIKSSGYFLLDDNTAETIQEAYIDYPRPQKPTPIRIFVKYKLIRQ